MMTTVTWDAADADAAAARIAEGEKAARMISTREGYVAACERLQVAVFLDEDLQGAAGYDARFGAYTWPAYPTDYIVAMRLARRRLSDFVAEAASAYAARTLPAGQPATPPKRGIQIWEPCACGSEPVYLPLLRCTRCWPTA